MISFGTAFTQILNSTKWVFFSESITGENGPRKSIRYTEQFG